MDLTFDCQDQRSITYLTLGSEPNSSCGVYQNFYPQKGSVNSNVSQSQTLSSMSLLQQPTSNMISYYLTEELASCGLPNRQNQDHESDVTDRKALDHSSNLNSDLHNSINKAQQPFSTTSARKLNCQQTLHSSSSHLSCSSSSSLPIRRRYRHNFSQQQIVAMERIFDQYTHYPDWTSLCELSEKLKLPPTRIQIWFQNRRAKFRRKVKDAERG